MSTDFQQIFNQAKKRNRLAEKTVFDLFAPKMLAIAKSYVGNLQDAEDVVLHSFLKAFSKIEECRSAASFQSWLRKIVINEAIGLIRKNKNLLYADEDVEQLQTEVLDEDFDETAEIDVDEVLEQMPVGYKLVFNLFVFEEKKHTEIARILNISEGTSRSQYSKAKRWILEFFKEKNHEKFSK